MKIHKAQCDAVACRFVLGVDANGKPTLRAATDGLALELPVRMSRTFVAVARRIYLIRGGGAATAQAVPFGATAENDFVGQEITEMKVFRQVPVLGSLMDLLVVTTQPQPGDSDNQAGLWVFNACNANPTPKLMFGMSIGAGASGYTQWYLLRPDVQLIYYLQDQDSDTSQGRSSGLSQPCQRIQELLESGSTTVNGQVVATGLGPWGLRNVHPEAFAKLQREVTHWNHFHVAFLPDEVRN